MKNKFSLKRLIFTLSLLLSTTFAFAQKAVFEVVFTDAAETEYKGIIVLNDDNSGYYRNTFMNEDNGQIWMTQDVTAEIEEDRFGNDIIYFLCSNPKGSDNYTYEYNADNFIVYPNGSFFTIDSGGNSTSDVSITIVEEEDWPAKLREYRVNDSSRSSNNSDPNSKAQKGDTKSR